MGEFWPWSFVQTSLHSVCTHKVSQDFPMQTSCSVNKSWKLIFNCFIVNNKGGNIKKINDTPWLSDNLISSGLSVRKTTVSSYKDGGFKSYNVMFFQHFINFEINKNHTRAKFNSYHEKQFIRHNFWTLNENTTLKHRHF